ncbi:MAG: YdcF family protein [Devosiaceae bacterium]|nr:YdcF family protein [Devosiaceae bacterium MH13]
MADLDLLPSKILSLLVRPDFWLWLGLVTVMAALLLRWYRLARWVTLSMVLAATLVAFVPIGSVLLTPLEARFPTNPPLPDEVAAIIVLGGGEDAATSVAWNSPNVNAAGDRITHALRRGRQFPEAPVIYAGGAFNPTGDRFLAGSAERVGALMVATGLSADRVHIANGSRVTADHPADIAPILAALDIDPSGETSLLLITSAFHMPRSVGVFCQAGMTAVLADPTDHRTTPGRPWQHVLRWNHLGNFANVQLAWREWAGLVAYAAAGHTPQIFPDGCAR